MLRVPGEDYFIAAQPPVPAPQWPDPFPPPRSVCMPMRGCEGQGCSPQSPCSEVPQLPAPLAPAPWQSLVLPALLPRPQPARAASALPASQSDRRFSCWGLTRHNCGPDPALSMPGCCPGCHRPLQPCPDALCRHHFPGAEEDCGHPRGCCTLRSPFPQPPNFGEESSKGNPSQKHGPMNTVALQPGSITGDSSGASSPLRPRGATNCAKATQSSRGRCALRARQWEARCRPDVSARS